MRFPLSPSHPLVIHYSVTALLCSTVRLYQAMSGIQMATKYSASDVSKPVSDTSEPTALAAQGIANDSNAGNNKLRAQDLLKKPALAKLLVLAARKVQEHKARTGEDFLSQRKLS